jgi:hypothetical protein
MAKYSWLTKVTGHHVIFGIPPPSQKIHVPHKLYHE